MIPAQAILATTQDHLEIEDIKEGIVILKDGGACLVIEVTSINYELLSEKEQEAIIYAYAGFLNSLNFPIQIVIRSQIKDVSSYLNYLKEIEKKETRPLIKEKIAKYAKFVSETVRKNNVLDKKFYIVVPMSVIEIGAVKALTTSFSPGKRKLPLDKTYILEKAKINLFPKRDHILRLLKRVGLRGRQLETKELIKLFFEIYNPQSVGQQLGEPEGYQKPMVQAIFPQNLSISEGSVSSPAFSQIRPQKEENYKNELQGNEEKTQGETHQVVFEKINKLVKEST